MKTFLLKVFCYFSRPQRLLVLNACLALIIVLLNNQFQGFCRPSVWAGIVLVISILNTVFNPMLINSRFDRLSAFLSGISCCVWLYCVVFLESALLAIVLPIPFAVPAFFMIQLILQNVVSPPKPALRHCFFLAAFMGVLFLIGSGIAYRRAASEFDNFKSNGYSQLNAGFMTEKILGMHFIYHTRICPYDGWRPPVHEPVLIAGLWLNNRYDPLEGMALDNRLKLYKKFFPGKTYKYTCSCAEAYSHLYHNDKLWK